jgi:hypothetical protein
MIYKGLSNIQIGPYPGTRRVGMGRLFLRSPFLDYRRISYQRGFGLSLKKTSQGYWNRL